MLLQEKIEALRDEADEIAGIDDGIKDNQKLT